MGLTKGIRTAAVLIAAALLVTACGGDDGGTGDQVSPDEVSGAITFWSYPIGAANTEQYWEPVVERFNEQYPDIDVEVIVQPWDGREEQLNTSLAGGLAPDVVYFNPDFVPKFVAQGVLEPVSDIVEDDLDDFRDSALEAMSYEGELYSVPLLMSVSSVICFKNVLEEAGVDCPTTWDEALEIAPAVKDAGYYLTQYPGTVTLNMSFYPYLLQAGGQVLDENGQAAFNGPEGVEALSFLRELADNDYVPQQSLTTSEDFEQSAAGRSEVAFLPNEIVSTVMRFVDPDNLIVSEPLTGVEQANFGTVGGLSIFNTSDNIDAAKIWVEFLTSPEEMESFNRDAEYSAARESVTGFLEDPLMVEQEQYLDTIWSAVPHEQAREIIDLIKPHIQAALLGRETPEAALNTAADEVNALLARG
ncbi:ABC transporter substrate-binding protein [Phytoactinopolyspora mesophila]|uniref:Extracellular solute-binding protein n=1 Tax=Phytoactinopolyspora mesophila TaxID=2650750 RepID=A0A7K3M9A7_9ACTN|nr:sugar ABC transporter substrate-binding protein [Phytoactinopolyspora mesophila]NDL59869.1 extracellular solute-binding protein [Phytoactinopolyspora mesophila]